MDSILEQLLSKHGSVEGERSVIGPESEVFVRRRGRPVFHDRQCSPMERRICLMHVAGASDASIAAMLGKTNHYVRDILHLPHCLSFIGFLNITSAQDMGPAVDKLNQAIETTASRAFVVARQNMEDLHEMGEELRGTDDRTSIRAKLGAVATAQDILDRAGKRAPTRVVSDVRHVIATEAIQHLSRVVEVVATRSGPALATNLEVHNDPGENSPDYTAGVEGEGDINIIEIPASCEDSGEGEA